MNLLDILKLDRPLIWFDTETTGPNPTSDRIVEIGLIKINPDGTTKEWQSYVNPLIPIPAEATFGNGDNYPGHGITDEMVKEAPSFKDLAPSLIKGFTQDVDYGGYNLKSFDLPLLAAEFRRHGVEWGYSKARLLDGYRLWQLGEARTLTDAVSRFLGRKHDGAHRALDDVRATLDVVTQQLTIFEQLPRNLMDLHTLAYPVDPNAIDPEGKIIWKDGVATMNFGKNWKGMALASMTKRNLLWIANDATGMSTEVKQICKDAAFGLMPRQKDLL